MRNAFIVFTLITLFTSCGSGSSEYKNRDFESDVWIKGDRVTRGQMTDSLLNDSILIGMRKDKVVATLGMPNDSNDDGSRYYWEVDIGLKAGPLGLGGVWLFWLNIDFDSTKNTVEAAWVSD